MTDEWIGRILSERYELLERIGAGGMSTVYKANDPNLDRIVAIKIIHPHLSETEDFIRRFRDEATSVAQLRHPNIVQVFDFNTDDDIAYIVFEFVAGETLQDRLQRLSKSSRSLPDSEAMKLGVQVASALDYAHSHGIVHRDVKPANIIIDTHGDAFLADFGIVKMVDGIQHTVTGAVVGTARYMSPEQIRGEQVDGRSDIYSLGVTLYEAASGEPPFKADSAMTLMMMHVTDPVPDPSAAGIAEPMGGIIEKAMAKQPDDRFADAAEMASALSAAQSIEAMPPPIPTTDSSITNSANEGGVSEQDSDRTTEPVVAAPAPETRTSNSRMVAASLGVLAVIAIGVLAATVFANGPTETTDGNLAIQDVTTTSSPPPTTTTVPNSTTTTAEPTTTTSPTTTSQAPIVPDGPAVGITTIELSDARYLVSYETNGYTEQLPGDHVHFYWNTVAEARAGVGPDQEDWFVWGGPRPFDGYRQTDQPEGATAICVVAANPDHTIKPGTGNCYTLPNESDGSNPDVRVAITDIELSDTRYLVSYETNGYTEQLPGDHVHFYWNTVAEAPAGVGPDQEDWFVWGGPRPFDGYRQTDQPEGATAICVVAANPDHTIKPGTGNCYSLP